MVLATIILFGAGFWVLGGLAWVIFNAYRSGGWTGRTTGVIVSHGQKNLQFPGRKHDRPSFQMSVFEYEYVVDGQVCRSSKLAYTPYRIGPKSKRSKLIAKLEPGREVEVYYNQNRPQEAVLYPGFEIFEFGSIPVALGVAGLFIGVGIAVWLDVFG